MSQSTFRGVGFRAATLERLEAEWLHWFDCEHQIGAVSRGCLLERMGKATDTRLELRPHCSSPGAVDPIMR